MKRSPTRRVLRALGFLLLGALAAGFGLGAFVFAAPGHDGPVTDHFDGRQFHNQGEHVQHGPLQLLEWQLNRDRGTWVGAPDAPPGPAPPERVAGADLRVTFVNHATVLVQTGGVNLLTDPIWSDRCSPVSFAGPARVRPPGIRFEDLPPIDAVLLSHNHYDHLDLPTLERLDAEHRPALLAGLGNGGLLRGADLSGRIEELDWWDGTEVAGLPITFVPAQHFSSRGFGDQNTTLWGGFVIGGPGGPIYFAGDTGFGPHFQQVRDRFGPSRLAILPIGAYLPRWFMSPVHIDPADAVRAHQVVGAGRSLGVHWGTFELADDGEDQPVRDLQEALRAANVSAERFWVLGFGEGRDVPPLGVGPGSP